MVIDIAKFRTTGPLAPTGTVYAVHLLARIRGLCLRHTPITLRELALLYHDEVRIVRPPDLPPDTELRIVIAEILQEGGMGSRTQPSVVGVFIPRGASVPNVVRYLKTAFPGSCLLDPDGMEVFCPCDDPLSSGSIAA